MDKTKINSYVLKQGSPDMSCVVMTTCKQVKQFSVVHVRHRFLHSLVSLGHC